MEHGLRVPELQVKQVLPCFLLTGLNAPDLPCKCPDGLGYRRVLWPLCPRYPVFEVKGSNLLFFRHPAQGLRLYHLKKSLHRIVLILDSKLRSSNTPVRASFATSTA